MRLSLNILASVPLVQITINENREVLVLGSIKWGIIGLGNIAAKFAQAIKKMDGIELQAVASRPKEKAEAFGKLFDVPAPKCCGSYEEVVQDESVDAIYCSTASFS